MQHSNSYKAQFPCLPFPLNAMAMKNNSTMEAALSGIQYYLCCTGFSHFLFHMLVSLFPGSMLKYLLAVRHLRHLSVLTHQKPTWAERVDVIVGPKEQIARQLARIDLLRGGRGRTEGEPATKKVLLLHGMSCGGFLKKKDRDYS